MVTRRLLLGALALTPFAGSNAFAQSATGEALDDFARYCGDTARLFGELAIGLRNADARSIRSPGATQALRAVREGLRNQAVANSGVVDELAQYHDFARQVLAELPAETSAAARVQRLASPWSGALAQVSQTAETVRRVTAIVDSSAELRGVLTTQQHMALMDTLAMRQALLERLSRSPPPTSAYELERLGRLIENYRRLIRTLDVIRHELMRGEN